MMDRLPREIVAHILSKLPLTSLLDSKLVCRAWRALIQDPFLISKHLSRMADATNDPSFILESNWPILDQHYFIDFIDHSEGRVISKKLPASYPISPMHLIDSCNGLLCMHDTSRTVFICNPFTRLYIELPKMTRYTTLVNHLQFGFHRTTNEYKAIQIVYRRQLTRVNSSSSSTTTTATTSVHSDVQILTIGSRSWRNLGTIPYGFINLKSKVFVNGRLHWLSMPNKYIKAILLVSFDIETERFQEVPKPDCCCGSAKCFRELTVARGRLSVGAFHDERLEIWVMKEYGVKESWVKEFSFGTYLPLTLTAQRGTRQFSYSRSDLFVRVLCVLTSGEILLEYKNRALVVYDPRHETFKEFKFPEMPDRFKIIVHVGSLNWLHD